MIPGNYFFAMTMNGGVLFCRVERFANIFKAERPQEPAGVIARCLNEHFDVFVPMSGRFHLPRTGEVCEVQLITGKLPCSENDHHAAIAHFRARKAVATEGIAR